VPAAEEAELRTVFMVLNQGRVAFEGSLAELNASGDPYVAKFVRHVE
jgi:ABC-type transporter Mla maintaining outer membrane lipid asymmetry ATPase subunit MlaF